MQQNNQNQIDCVCVDDFEQVAKQKLPLPIYQYFSAGANSQITLQENRISLERILFNPKVLVDVSKIDLSATILGEKVKLPIGIAPSAMHKLADSEGERATAAVASDKGIIYTLSTMSTTPIQEVAKASGNGLRWFQLYIIKNRQFTIDIIKQAENNGFKALVLTCDSAVIGKRHQDQRSSFQYKPKLEIVESLGHYLKENANKGDDIWKLFSIQRDDTINWNDIKWLKSQTKLPIVMKGIQCKEDALKCAELGLHVWISNHGGRQLDGVRAVIDILPECVKAIKEINEKTKQQIEIYVDGGVRSGNDVIKYLALGANCIFIGRPIIYSLATNGKMGLTSLFNIIEKDMNISMKLIGCSNIRQLSEKYLVKNTIPKPNL